VINEEEVHGTKYYWMEYGQGQTSILDLVEHHRKSHRLYIHINNSASEDTTQITHEMVGNNEPEHEELIPVARISPIDLQQQTPYRVYFHGDMEKEEVEKLLENQTEGTFIIRNNGGYRISRVPFGNGSRMWQLIKFIQNTCTVFSKLFQPCV
jgi:hypothetical protein